MEHKYFLGIERGYDPTIIEAVDSWEQNHAWEWRSRKMRRDAEAQVKEIENCRRELCSRKGCKVDFTEATRVWLNDYEADWRSRWESSPCSGA